MAKNKSKQIFIWLPPRNVGERAFSSEVTLIVMAVAGGNARYYRSSLDALEGVKSAILILDARDVTLLRAALPALTGAKLAKVIPNAVEDLLLQDVNSCALVLGPRFADSADSMVGVVDRSWLDLVTTSLERKGIRVDAVVPAQLVLPMPEESKEAQGTTWAVACYHNGLAIRTDQLAGFGWGAGDTDEFKTEALRSALLAARQATGANSPHVAIYIENDDWHTSATEVLQQIQLRATITSLPIPTIDSYTIDFASERSGSRSSRFFGGFNWKAWKVPALVLGAATACFLLGLNLHWGQLNQEKSRLKAESERRFRQAFPQTQVVVDPLIQMQRNVATLRVQAGQAGPEDFVPLASKLSSALATVAPLQGAANNGNNAPVRAAEAIQTMDYRAAKLRVKFTTGLMDNRSNREAISASGARFGLKFEFENDNMLLVSAQ
jgi:general secretion pathway protein L